jgi:hypothetical protein
MGRSEENGKMKMTGARHEGTLGSEGLTPGILNFGSRWYEWPATRFDCLTPREKLIRIE